MRTLGAIFDREAEAEEYIQVVHNIERRCKNAVKDLNLPKVYLESAALQQSLESWAPTARAPGLLS